jgi:glycosidase
MDVAARTCNLPPRSASTMLCAPAYGYPMKLWLSSLLLLACTSVAQQPRIDKIDPPDWWVSMPAPMLLLHGENLSNDTYTLSNSAIHIDKTVPSANGHYVQLWLSATPDSPETIQITVASAAGQSASYPYTFAARRASSDGMAGFSQQDVMYLIMIDRFADGDLSNDGPDAHSAATSAEAAAERAKPRGWHGGDLRGIEQHLDYLQSLGVTTVWPTPVYQNHGPEAYHGYHATDYYAVDEHYGSLDDLKSLVKALHARGMKLVLDTVPNHVGPFHPWVDDEPAPNWFHGTKAQHIRGETNFEALIDAHAPERDRVATLQGWFAGLLPDMNTEDPSVAQYLRQNTVWWIEQTGADGLRIDTFPYVDRAFWHRFTAELHALYPHLTEVGEVSNGDPEITSAFADGVSRAGVDTGLYTPFDFPFYHATRDIFVRDAPMTRLTRVLLSDELYNHPERLVPFLGNHDVSRFAEAVRDPALRKVAYTLLLTTRGTPQLYAGDELAMRGGDDPDNRRDFPSAAFTASGRASEQQDAFVNVQQLLALRRQHPALQYGSEEVIYADKDVLVVVRSLASEKICIAMNKGHMTQKISIALDRTELANAAEARSLLGDSAAMSLRPHELHLNLTPEAAAIAEIR